MYIKPPCEAKRSAGKLWKLKKTLYAAQQFYDSIREELTNLALVQSKVDPSLFYKVNNGEVIGAIITHIDDFMHCGSALFDNIVIKPLLECFILGKQETNKFCYIGFGINQNHKEITLDQGKYVTDLQGIRIDPGRAKEKSSLLTPEEQKQLRSLVGKCNWVAQGTRPDLAY